MLLETVGEHQTGLEVEEAVAFTAGAGHLSVGGLDRDLFVDHLDLLHAGLFLALLEDLSGVERLQFAVHTAGQIAFGYLTVEGDNDSSCSKYNQSQLERMEN